MARYLETPNIHLRKPDVTDPDKTLGYWGEDLNFSLDTLDTYLWNAIGDVSTLTLPVTNLTAAVNLLDSYRPSYVLKDGKLGGQTICGGTAAGENINLVGNSTDNYGIRITGDGKIIAYHGIYGNYSSSSNLTIGSTTSGTKGKIYLGSNSVYDEANIRLGIGTPSPEYSLEIYKNGTDINAPRINLTNSGAMAGEASGFVIFDANAGPNKTTLSTTLDGSILGAINARGVTSENTRSSSANLIMFAQDGAAGTFVPGRIQFFTASSSAPATEKLRIDSTGLISTTGTIQAGNYKSSDGSTGATVQFTFNDPSTGFDTLVTVKNGIITSVQQA